MNIFLFLLTTYLIKTQMKYTECKSSSDCESGMCQIIYNDESDSSLFPVISGVCVMCRDDCDCPVNM